MLIAGCSQNAASESLLTVTPSPTLPSPEIVKSSMPDSLSTVEEFYKAWESNDYQTMYSLLDNASKSTITENEFSNIYKNADQEMARVSLDYEIMNTQTSSQMAEVELSTVLGSAIVGDILRNQKISLNREDEDWRIAWDKGLILPEIADGNELSMQYDLNQRANIYDHDGDPLAIQTEATALGLYPDFINLDDDFGIVILAARVTGIPAPFIESMIRSALPGAYIPLGEVANDEDPSRLGILTSYGAVASGSYNSRLYPNGGTSPHVVGYVSSIQEDELTEYRLKGYQGGERVGRDGIEKWGESILGGKNGGTLMVLDQEGKPVAEIGSSPRQPGQEIFTTLDSATQLEAQHAIQSFRGAIVVLERDTGKLIAMVSSPGFNPNAYQFENINWNTMISEITNNPDNPHYNRGAQGQYPLGSVFKVITAAAALESGVYTPETIYECGYVFEELFGFPRYDWTYERFQEDGVTRPSGTLTLVEGLIRSCNPYFWHIGLDLYQRGLTTAISDMARGFGLGSLTGIEVIEEEAGQVPDPVSEVDAINLAIGQGDLLVTPLQVANFMAAIGNGGTLYKPQAIDKIVTEGGVETFSFAPEVFGTLPVSPGNLEAIKEGMIGVVSSEMPPGTAYRAFAGLDIPVAGKTGTATSGSGEPHSWFAGYTFAEKSEKPDIAVAVIVENIGDGSEFAAPVFRRIVETYFLGEPQKLYQWEAQLNVTRTPTPIVTDTPTPNPIINR